MKKVKLNLKKLELKKEKIAALTKENLERIYGGGNGIINKNNTMAPGDFASQIPGECQSKTKG